MGFCGKDVAVLPILCRIGVKSALERFLGQIKSLTDLERFLGQIKSLTDLERFLEQIKSLTDLERFLEQIKSLTDLERFLELIKANPTTLKYQFEPEIERVCRRNRKESRAMTDPPNNRNAANNNQIAVARGGNPPLAIPPIQVQNRSIRDHLLPDLGNLNPGIVTPEIQAAQFELKPVMFNMLNSIGQFGGSPHEDARQHLRSFIEGQTMVQ
ncbi:hypothetical protein V6N13_075406 [Hibiscus sabdariffa]|uniref:FRIGIDA-like protein n=1 Tax=Hibiscus sabdariffa TaxID=183260 RepID=A0ABR2UBP0_9ROSI